MLQPTNSPISPIPLRPRYFGKLKRTPLLPHTSLPVPTMTNPQAPTPTMLRPVIHQLRRQLAQRFTGAAVLAVLQQLLTLEGLARTPAPVKASWAWHTAHAACARHAAHLAKAAAAAAAGSRGGAHGGASCRGECRRGRCWGWRYRLRES